MKVSNVLIGKSRGSIGNVTFTTWKGINVAKEKATEVANPNTEGQQVQRSMFSKAVAVYKQIAEVVAFGFMQKAVKQSAYNAFTSFNLKAGAFAGGLLGKIGVPASFSIAQGTLTPTPIDSVNAEAGQTSITFVYDATVTGNQSEIDKVRTVVAKADGTIIGYNISDNDRNSGESDCDLNVALLNGATYHLYVFFYQAATRRVSNSVHKTFVAEA